MYQQLLRPMLFAYSKDDPEKAHDLVLSLLERVGKSNAFLNLLERFYRVDSKNIAMDLWGLHFRNPLGLAAGFDKNCVALDGLAALGFGFLEGGCVTFYDQPGNERPRIVRIPECQALINRMGFNNEGAAAIQLRLRARAFPLGIPLFMNIGKAKIVKPEHTVETYCETFKRMYDYTDGITINVSSPNTPGLRDLQQRGPLDELLGAIMETRRELIQRGPSPRKPILVKISPDLTSNQLFGLLDIAIGRGVDGIVATNTTMDHSKLPPTVKADGGASGPFLLPRTLDVVRQIRGWLPNMPIIGVGGICNWDDARRMQEAGANLVQIFTAMVYQGPSVVKEIVQGLVEFKKRAPVIPIRPNPSTPSNGHTKIRMD